MDELFYSSSLEEIQAEDRAEWAEFEARERQETLDGIDEMNRDPHFGEFTPFVV